LYLSERNVYGSSRVGVENVNQIIASTNTANININSENTPITCAQKMGDKHYELSNHLGNVLEVISDRKYSNDNGSGGVDYYLADVVSYSDYFPFGMQLPGRNGGASEYKYGYMGYEGDPEIKGEGNSYTTDFRQYDHRIGRWLSLDPMATKYPNISPYAAFANNPLIFTDPGGDTIVIVLVNSTDDPTIYAVGQNIVKEQVNDGVFIVVGHGNINDVFDKSIVGGSEGLDPAEFSEYLDANEDWMAAKTSGIDMTLIVLNCNAGTEPVDYNGYKTPDSQDAYAERLSEFQPNIDIWAADGYVFYSTKAKDASYILKGIVRVSDNNSGKEEGFVLFRNGESKVKLIYDTKEYVEAENTPP